MLWPYPLLRFHWYLIGCTLFKVFNKRSKYSSATGVCLIYLGLKLPVWELTRAQCPTTESVQKLRAAAEIFSPEHIRKMVGWAGFLPFSHKRWYSWPAYVSLAFTTVFYARALSTGVSRACMHCLWTIVLICIYQSRYFGLQETSKGCRRKFSCPSDDLTAVCHHAPLISWSQWTCNPLLLLNASYISSSSRPRTLTLGLRPGRTIDAESP